MSTWLKLLGLELDSIANSDIIEPDYDKMNKGDHIVGKMSDLARRLYTLSCLLEKSAGQYTLDGKYCRDTAEKLRLESKTHELAAKSQVIKDIMWIIIREELDLWNVGIGVRKDFKVITTEDSDNDMPSFFKRLFGGEL